MHAKGLSETGLSRALSNMFKIKKSCSKRRSQAVLAFKNATLQFDIIDPSTV